MTEYAHVTEDEELDYGNELGLDEPAEPEVQAAPEPEPEPAKPEPTTSIPYDRFKEVNDRLKEEREARASLEARLQQLEARTAPPPEPEVPAFDLDAKIADRNSAILEGDDAKAAQIEREIRKHERESLRAEIEQSVMGRQQQESYAAQQMAQLQQTSVQLVQQFPFLDSNSAEADNAAIARVLDLRNALIQAGQPYAEALKMAVYREVMESGRLPAAPTAAPATTATDKVLRNAKAAASQPPPTTSAGAGSPAAAINVDDISGEEWMKLPAKERERLLV